MEVYSPNEEAPVNNFELQDLEKIRFQKCPAFLQHRSSSTVAVSALLLPTQSPSQPCLSVPPSPDLRSTLSGLKLRPRSTSPSYPLTTAPRAGPLPALFLSVGSSVRSHGFNSHW